MSSSRALPASERSSWKRLLGTSRHALWSLAARTRSSWTRAPISSWRRNALCGAACSTLDSSASPRTMFSVTRRLLGTSSSCVGNTPPPCTGHRRMWTVTLVVWLAIGKWSAWWAFSSRTEAASSTAETTNSRNGTSSRQFFRCRSSRPPWRKRPLDPSSSLSPSPTWTSPSTTSTPTPSPSPSTSLPTPALCKTASCRTPPLAA
mmetsp:Transcript_28017/g.66382  ORF Transcript_28017/g.66382 Transcript_28017/m.66382 type:complete len:205 (-) Transcript_28017:294-908(-)